MAALVILGSTMCSPAQDVKSNHASDQTELSRQTLTGCLLKGEQPDEFKLEVEEGGVWRIKGDNRELLAEVGQTVTVSGDSPTPDAQTESAGNIGNSTGTPKGVTPPRQLTVVNLVRVSDGCQNDLGLQ
jgi:hypothetical protein